MEAQGLICEPITPFAKCTPGSIEDHCSECGRDVWVSVAGQRMLRNKLIPILCLPCGMPHVAGGAKAVAAPGAMDELREAAGQEAVDFAQMLLAGLEAERRQRSN